MFQDPWDATFFHYQNVFLHVLIKIDQPVQNARVSCNVTAYFIAFIFLSCQRTILETFLS